MRNETQNEVCVYCSGMGWVNKIFSAQESQGRIACPLCKGTGRLSSPEPYLTRDGFLSIEIADRLISHYGPIKGFELIDTGDDRLINVELFFEEDVHFKLGGFAIGYFGTRPDLFVKLANKAGNNISADEVAKIRSPRFYFFNDQNNGIEIKSDLLWQAECDGEKRTYADALTYCAQLHLADLQHWRLPTLEECQRIGHQIDKEYCDFWTASLEPDLGDNLAYIDDGTTMFVTNQYYVKAVHEISLPLAWVLKSEQFLSTGRTTATSPSSIPDHVKVQEPIQKKSMETESEKFSEFDRPKTIIQETGQPVRKLPIPPPFFVAQNGNGEFQHNQDQSGHEPKEIPHSPPPLPSRSEINTTKKKHTKELSGLGYFLAILITVILTIILTIVFVPSLPGKISGNQGDIVDFAGYLGSISGMVCGISIFVGSITYAIIKALFQNKNRQAQNISENVSKTVAQVNSSLPVARSPVPRKEKAKIVSLSLLLLIGLIVIIVVIVRHFHLDQSTLLPSGEAKINLSGETISGCVSTSSLRIRSGPGTEYSVVKGLSNGECLTFDGRDPSGEWIRLSPEYSTENDQRFWVSADFVSLNGEISKLPVITVP